MHSKKVRKSKFKIDKYAFIFSGWALSIYYHSYYNSIIKTRTMSGVTFDETNCLQGLESLSLRSDLLVPKITSPTQVLVRVHAGSVDAVDIAILSGKF